MSPGPAEALRSALERARVQLGEGDVAAAAQAMRDVWEHLRALESAAPDRAVLTRLTEAHRALAGAVDVAARGLVEEMRGAATSRRAGRAYAARG